MSTPPPRASAHNNRWYVLATIMGEPTGSSNDDEVLQAANRRVWNSWASQGLSDEEKRGKVEKSEEAGYDPFQGVEPWSEICKSEEAGYDPFEGVEPWSEICGSIEAKFNERLPDKEIPDPSKRVNFENLSFEAPVSFKRFFFKEQANFSGATFTKGAHFNGASFTKGANFRRASFTKDAEFSRARFTELVDFSLASFTKGASFFGASFTKDAHFSRARFTEDASFFGARFTEDAHFRRARFTEDASFFGARFTKGADFDDATFEGRSYFQEVEFKGSVDFTEAGFDKPCNLRKAKFTKEYPRLEGTNLHAKTTITADDSHWPRVESSKLWKRWAELTVFILPVLWIWGVHVVPFLRLWGEPVDLSALLFTPLYTLPYVIVFATVIGLLLTPFAKKTVLRSRQKKTITDEKKDKEAITSCAHLRHNMAAQGLPEHAHFFFRREMALKSQTVSGWGKGWYWAYQKSSDFGHSLLRPFLGLVFLWLLMAGVLCLVNIPACSALNPLKHSFANMFPSFLFSARKHFPDSCLVHAPWLEWLMWFQTILGTVLVFLFILGLRNRFRL